MFDLGRDGHRLERMRGCADVALGFRGVERLFQQGSGKAILPRTYGPVPEVVFLNTAGGLTGGDRLEMRMTLSGRAAIATTQTAERAYRSTGDEPAQVRTHLTVGKGAKLAWLPQETILFDGADLSRDTVAEIAGDAELILLDSFVLGRVAMGETVENLRLKDTRRVIRDGRPVLIEPLKIDADDLIRPGVAGVFGARAFAAMHLVAADAEDRLARLRAVLPGDGSAAASAWDGRLSLRLISRDPADLRRTLSRAIPCLSGQPLPRVWPH